MTQRLLVMTSKQKSDLRPPPSPTNLYINFTGLGVCVLSLVLIRQFGKGMSNFQAEFLCLFAYAGTIVALEFLFLKTFSRKSTGLDFSDRLRPRSLKSAARKLVGFGLTLALVALGYAVFPEYQGSFYGPFFGRALRLLPILFMLAVPYFLFIDRRMARPEDGYWHTATLLLGRWRDIDRKVLRQHALAWLVKMFFLPLMFLYFAQKVDYFRNVDFSSILDSFRAFYEFAFNMLFFGDLLVATVGYILTLRLFDSHVRSTEPSCLGWLVAVGCYQPFWDFCSGRYLRYDSGTFWFEWLHGHPIVLPLWGSTILALLAIYVWATIAFGVRFSNLTNRGILTNGPYRYTKHPAYVSKNLSWWLISMPFLSQAGTTEALQHCFLLALLNVAYLLRARTEERHLSSDPAYVEYAEYMESRGLFSWLGRALPVLKFRPGKLFNL